MDISKPIDPTELFSAKDLVVVITGGATGMLPYAFHAMIDDLQCSYT